MKKRKIGTGGEFLCSRLEGGVRTTEKVTQIILGIGGKPGRGIGVNLTDGYCSDSRQVEGEDDNT